MRTKKYTNKFDANSAAAALQNSLQPTATTGTQQSTSGGFWATFFGNSGNNVNSLANLVGAVRGNQPQTNNYYVQEEKKTGSNWLIIGIIAAVVIFGGYMLLKK